MRTKLSLIGLFLLFFYGSWHFGRLRLQDKPELRSDYSPQSSRLSLLSWNIGYFDFEADSRAQDHDLEHIASVISEAGPDVVTLQEIAAPEQVGTLDELLDGQYPYQALARGFRTDRYVVILSRIPFQNEAHIATSVGRDAAAVGLAISPGYREVTVVNCHADAFNSRRRRYFVTDVIDWYRGSGRGNVILAGDFNLDLTPVESSDLFTDDKKNDSESYSLILENFRDSGKGAGPTSSFDRRIDYVFVSSPVLEVSEFRVLRGKLVGRMDHHPLLVRFGWKG
jgi:endonuclease/exonuclease/phosphatase family metal-dependent hydrolase